MSVQKIKKMEAGWAGIVCAFVGNILISLSFQMQRLVHVNSEENVSYVRVPLWWLGILCMAVGEIGNLMAYGMAPASVVAPLGAVAVISNACLSRVLLGEVMSYKGVFGVLCALTGAALVVVNAPKARDRVSMYDGVASWSGLVCVLAVVALAVYIANPWEWKIAISKEFASKRVVCYCALCSLLGGVTVTGAKYVSTAVNKALAGEYGMFVDSETCWLTYVLLAGVLTAAALQVMYLNEALRNFGASLVVPVYYILFTSVSIGTGMVLFDETVFEPAVWGGAMFVAGVVLAFFGVFVVNNQRIDSTSFGETRLSALFGSLEIRNCLLSCSIMESIY